MNGSPACESTTVAALLTPAGRGAVAVVRVRGPGAAAAVADRFQPAASRPIADTPVGRIAFGRWCCDVDSPAEELIVVRRDVDEWEIHGHGGPAAVAVVLRSLEHSGCRIASWREALASQHDDPSVVEAFEALADAATTRTAAIALDQTTGALTRALEDIRALQTSGAQGEARRRRDRLLALSAAGRYVRRPAKVALVGRPNVGKSSLLNALVGYRRAIVFDEPGTTRDVVGAPAVFDGWPIELLDTAGLRDAGDALEAEGIERARRLIAEADLVLLVCDASLPWTDDDRRRCAELPQAIIVHNKTDLRPATDDRPPGVDVSARSGAGLVELMRTIVAALVPDPPQAGEGVPLTDRQTALVRRSIPDDLAPTTG